MDRTQDSVGNGYKLFILGDLNGWIGDRTRVGVTFGVPGEDYKGRKVEFCAERGMYVDNTCFKHRSLHNYTRVARGLDRAELRA